MCMSLNKEKENQTKTWKCGFYVRERETMAIKLLLKPAQVSPYEINNPSCVQYSAEKMQVGRTKVEGEHLS